MGDRQPERSEKLLKAFLVIFAGILLSTEVLSAAGLVNAVAIRLFWLGALAAVVTFWIRKRDRDGTPPVRPGGLDPWAVAIAGTLLAGTLLAALIYPPNNWDSHIYHLPRVMHWMENGQLDFYPTPILQQNYQMPLGGMALLHIMLLTGTDLAAGLVQWTAYLVMLVLAWLIAGELGFAARARSIAVVLTATLPMVVLQASSTQTDLLVTVFIGSFTLFMMRWRRAPHTATGAWACLSLGLALLAKGTAYLLCAPVGILFALPVLWERRRELPAAGRAFAALAAIAGGALLMTVPHMTRALAQYDHPLATEDEQYWVEGVGPASVASNLLRGASIHLATPVEAVNQLHRDFLGTVLGEELNRRETTWEDSEFGVTYRRNDDFAGNFFQFLLLLGGLAAWLFIWRRRGRADARLLAGVVLAQAVILVVFFKWHPWASRWHTPLFLLAMPLLGGLLATVRHRLARRILPAGLAVISLYSLWFVVDNQMRPLAPGSWMGTTRNERLFHYIPAFREPYMATAEFLNAADHGPAVGLVIGNNDWEYPLWRMTHSPGGKRPAFVHLPKPGSLSADPLPENLPKYIVSRVPLRDSAYSALYEPVHHAGFFTVLRKRTP